MPEANGLEWIAGMVAGLAAELTTWPHLLAPLAAAAAGLMRGFTGFGAAMLMAPVFAVLFGPVQTIAIIVAMEVCVTAQLLHAVGREAQWRFVLAMGAPATLFMPLGLWVLSRVDAGLIARVIAAVVVAFVVVLAAGWRYRGPRRLPITLGVGALSGFMMATTSIGNPPVLLYMLSGTDAAATHRANIIAYVAVTMVALLGVMAAQGLVGAEVLVRTGLLFAPFAAFVWIGSRLFHQANERLYRLVALTVLFIVGVAALLR